MDDKEIIARLLDTNERNIFYSNVKFWIACCLLALSLFGNIYQAVNQANIELTQDYDYSNENINDVR